MVQKVKLRDLFPVTVSDARVADDVEQRLVRLELLNLSAHAVSDIARCRLVGERFTELVQSAAHVAQLLLNSVSAQLLERTCTPASLLNTHADGSRLSIAIIRVCDSVCDSVCVSVCPHDKKNQNG